MDDNLPNIGLGISVIALIFSIWSASQDPKFLSWVGSLVGIDSQNAQITEIVLLKFTESGQLRRVKDE